jgi:hypothetical protein
VITVLVPARAVRARENMSFDTRSIHEGALTMKKRRFRFDRLRDVHARSERRFKVGR